jgi:hypothetical protein
MTLTCPYSSASCSELALSPVWSKDEKKLATITAKQIGKKMKTYDPKKYHIGKVVNGYVCLICPLCDSLLIEAIGNVRFGSVICGQCCINGNEKTLHFYQNIDGLYSLQVDK